MHKVLEASVCLVHGRIVRNIGIESLCDPKHGERKTDFKKKLGGTTSVDLGN